MLPSPAVPGQALPAPLLEQYARPALIPPEDFVGSDIFPDAKVDSFYGIAPVPGNEELENIDTDDTVGRKTDFLEITFAADSYDFQLGMRARKVIIGAVDIEKARIQQLMAGGGTDALFDLESRGTNLIVAQHVRRNEFLKMRLLQTEGSYPEGHVLDPIEIDTISATNFVQNLTAAARRVGSAGRGPANYILFGDGAWNGAMGNGGFADLFPDTAYKIMSTEMFLPVLKLPDDANPRVRIATATYKPKGKRRTAPVPMFNNFIWIGRVEPNPGETGGNGYGRGYWHPCMENGQRNYVNRLLVGNAETRHISVKGYDRPAVNDPKLGVLIPVTLAA
jgi:hypothetical protein